MASGHLALDPGGCHPPDQESTLIFWQAATIWVATVAVAAAAVERVSSPRPSPTIRESGRRPPGDNVGDSRRPLEESPDHLGKTWGNQLIAHNERFRTDDVVDLDPPRSLAALFVEPCEELIAQHVEGSAPEDRTSRSSSVVNCVRPDVASTSAQT